MGCLPGNTVVTTNRSLGDPLYLNVNGSHLAFVWKQLKKLKWIIKLHFNDQSKHQRRFNRESKYRKTSVLTINRFKSAGNYPGITVEKKIGFCKLPIM
jgi:hypothetical protein